MNIKAQEQYAARQMEANARLAEVQVTNVRNAVGTRPEDALSAEGRALLAPKPANEMAILRRVLKALEPLDWQAKLRVLDYVRSAAAGAETLSMPHPPWYPR